MKKVAGLLIVLQTLTLAVFAQQSISSTVVDTNGETLPGAHVALMNQDSSVIISQITNVVGEFEMSEVPTGELILKTSFIGYQAHFKL